ITIYAGVIDEEVTLNVFGIGTVGVGHTLILKQCINLRDAAPVTLFSELAGQPNPDDISHLLVRDHFTTERQDVRPVMFAAVTRRSFVVTHCSTDTWDLIGSHARTDPGAVDHNPEIAGLTGYSQSNGLGKIGVIHWRRRICSKILIFVRKILK